MKKNTLWQILLIAVLAGAMLTACQNNNQPAPAQTNADTTGHVKTQTNTPDTLGGSGWSETFIIRDSKGEPISGALVSAPCTGQPARTSSSTGVVTFTGTAPCTCNASQATVTTNKGCNQKINITCDSTYTVTCTQ